MNIDWTNWKWDGKDNVDCRCSTCYPIFGRALKWTVVGVNEHGPVAWLSEAGTTAFSTAVIHLPGGLTGPDNG